ncbi:putative gag-polypeptide of LTR copia-type [Lyophyllum shimeji]|uniref:Gag-polypeptide of LTR copia-type n=1 Tax=Lyophyllum shimeji TaxID=47721 RepID=A0A9P3Q1E0_LYOSH|nr:putative gag-polypeptide of LTR copia-type [Lyophyllum shimeji]
MEAVLVRQDYWDLFLEDAVSGLLDPKELKDVKRRMAEARASTILRVDDSQLPHMVDPNPKVVWDTLAKVHRACGFGSRLHLRRTFITATMTEGQSMEAWIGHVRSLANRLIAIDVKVSDEDMIVVLTAGLPPSYTTVVISFDAIDADKLTHDFVITRLLNEEGRQVILAAPEVKEEEKESVAMVASATLKRKANVVCSYCGELGHFVADCKTRIKHFKIHETIAAKACLEDAEEENFAF